MKNIFSLGIPCFVLIFLTMTGTICGQGGWNTAPFDQKVFVENKGQFNTKTIGGRGEVQFSCSQKGIEMFWTAKGLVYKVSEIYVSEELKREAEREGKPEEIFEKAELKYHYLEMEWIGSNPNVKMVSENPVSFYYTYGDPKDKSGKTGIKALAYKKIIYKDLYPGIDAEYILPEKGGVKYSFIVHPGADPSVIRVRYKGADKVFLNSSGGIEINSHFCGNFLEHSPETFYEDGTTVGSLFQYKNGTIGFSIPSYDKTKTLVIDPWVSVITFPSTTAYTGNSKSGYDVSYDNSGNVWVYGGGSPCYLSKYSSGGALQWVFSVPLSSVWLVGDLEVNKNSGSAYVSEGYNGFGAEIVKVNAAGMLVATFPGNTRNLEISRIRLDCSGRLWVTGGGVPTGLWQAASVDTNLTAMSGSHITTSQNGDHDANLMTLDPTGNFMYINFNYPAPGSMDFLHNNEMHKIPLPGYTPSTWVNAGPIYHFEELGSIPYSGNANNMWASRINMFNGMVCGNGALYTYNGDTIKKWDKNTGIMLGQVKTNGKVYWTGGIDLDLCENVYASVGNAVKVYDPNLNLINTYPLPDTSCYDLKVDKNRNLVYACGNGFVAAIAITPLTPPTLNLTTSATPATGCSSCTGTATANFTVNSPCANAFNYTYSWLPGGQVTPTITGLCPGTYTVIASANMVCAKILGDTAIVVIPGGAGVLQDDFTFTGTCGAMTFADTATSGITNWNWSFPGGSPSSSAVQSPPSISYPQGTYTATLIVSSGPGCTDTIVHTFTVGGFPTAAFQSSAPCLGSSTTLLDGSVSSQGDPIQTWNWAMNGGSPTSATNQNPTVVYTSAGTHSVVLVVTTQSGCKDTIIQQVLVYNPPVVNFSGSGAGCAPVCVNNFLDASASVDGNITGWTWSFPGGSPSASSSQVPPTICYNVPGNYGASLIVTTVYGCKDTLSINPLVNVHAWPTADFCVAPDKAPATDPVFSFCDLWSPNPGVTNWVWNFGDGSFDSSSTDPVHTYSPAATQNGFFSYHVCLTVQNQYGCWDTTCKTVEIIPEFEFYVPNAFTPNGDFTNEYFFGKGRGIKEYTIWLFDRWGNNIWDCHYEGDNTAWDNAGQEGMSSGCKWDGKVEPGGTDMSGKNKQLVQEDVYVWKVKLTDVFDKQHTYMGHVTVVQ